MPPNGYRKNNIDYRIDYQSRLGQICEYFLLGINEEMANWLAEPALTRFVNTSYKESIRKWPTGWQSRPWPDL